MTKHAAFDKYFVFIASPLTVLDNIVENIFIMKTLM